MCDFEHEMNCFVNCVLWCDKSLGNLLKVLKKLLKKKKL